MHLFSVVLKLSLVKLLMISCFMKVTQHEIGVLYVLFKLHRQAQKVQLTRVAPDTNILGATVYKYQKGEETLNRFVWILWPPDANNTNSYFASSIKWFTPAPLTQTPPPYTWGKHLTCFSKSTQHIRGRRANSRDLLVCQRALKKSCSVFWMWVFTMCPLFIQQWTNLKRKKKSGV